MEYRHGPISITSAGRVVWAFGEVPTGLAEQVRATGGHFEHADRDPMADLVRRAPALPESGQGGRAEPRRATQPDPFDHPRVSSGCVLAVDVGGTSIKAEIVDAGLRCCAAASAPTPDRTAPGCSPPSSI